MLEYRGGHLTAVGVVNQALGWLYSCTKRSGPNTSSAQPSTWQVGTEAHDERVRIWAVTRMYRSMGKVKGVRVPLAAHLSVAVVVDAVAAEALEQRGRGKPAGPAACPVPRTETEA